MSELYLDIREDQWPIVYHPGYNISFGGLEKLHVFDSHKWGHIVEFLQEAGMLSDTNYVEPKEVAKSDLRTVHSKKYLQSLKWSFNVAKIAEFPLLALVPNFVVQATFLKPMRLQTGGSMLAGKLALERGWAINVGGGLHHCSAARGGGFCVYADITLLVRRLQSTDLARDCMIVDLDAHQGNGHATDFMNDNSVYIMDMYNKGIYPRDKEARRAVRRRVELEHHTDVATYMAKLKRNFEASLRDFHPDIVVYNAGTDILEDDPLGNLDITAEGIIQRDEYMFATCKAKDIPIVMLTSGGYLKRTARIIADSILNLRDKGIISCQGFRNEPPAFHG